MVDTAALLRDARTRSHLTQEEVALAAGVSQPMIAAYEAGRREPTLSTLTRLLKACGHTLHVDATPDPVTYWQSRIPVIDQARTVLSIDPGAVVSGDIAADLIDGWKVSAVALLDTTEPVDLTNNHAFRRVSDPRRATCILRSGRNTRPATTHHWRGTDFPLAALDDVIADLHELGGEDRAEAADRLVAHAGR